jgi:hypothetical protein
VVLKGRTLETQHSLKILNVAIQELSLSLNEVLYQHFLSSLNIQKMKWEENNFLYQNINR